ncbi:MAG: abortive infection family protein [Chlorobium sp.]|uniref:abortive infection family protein n=1 Tax=Chlorobium sp. TaxID=1095 RepID=UPI0025C61035|nr:abortive infection family protein [Chlorobium sp.]MCF8382638.1 abortive infection family protein [Chlorobium sp.]
MEKLRATIEKYGHWKELGDYVDRMEAHLEVDFSLSIENAKALLESIGKEICKSKSITLGTVPSVNEVLRKSFRALGYSNDNLVKIISTSLGTIGHEIGTLRNEISPTSHGKPLDELRERNNKVDLLTRDFLIDSTVIVAVFLIRAFEERKDEAVQVEDAEPSAERLKYDESEDFNDSWDEAFGEFIMGTYSYPASEILYGVDYKAYETEYNAFQANQLEEETEESNEPFD